MKDELIEEDRDRELGGHRIKENLWFHSGCCCSGCWFHSKALTGRMRVRVRGRELRVTRSQRKLILDHSWSRAQKNIAKRYRWANRCVTGIEASDARLRLRSDSKGSGILRRRTTALHCAVCLRLSSLPTIQTFNTAVVMCAGVPLKNSDNQKNESCGLTQEQLADPPPV